MSKITKFAKGKDCTARIPGVCCFDAKQTMWAHIRKVRFGAGTAKKPNDLAGLIACYPCHMVFDGQLTYHGPLSRKDIELCMYEGHIESLLLLEKAGILEVVE